MPKDTDKVTIIFDLKDLSWSDINGEVSSHVLLPCLVLHPLNTRNLISSCSFAGLYQCTHAGVELHQERSVLTITALASQDGEKFHHQCSCLVQLCLCLGASSIE